MKPRNLFLIAVFFCAFLVVHDHAFSAVVRDADGNLYATVEIGHQEWMAENLEVRHYRNGDPIRHAMTSAEWRDAAMNGEGAWCYYLNRTDYGYDYGILYNWYAISDPRGLAPEGWHIPDDREWKQLTASLGGRVTAGGVLKASMPAGGHAQGRYLTVSERFAALPGGYRRNDGRFCYGETHSYFWTASEFIDGFAWFRHLTNAHDMVFRNDTSMGNGMSVRCVRDASSVLPSSYTVVTGERRK
ncbi:fibrobacter succinogenes major paralogous domain-containing protein [Prosthecochloris sp. N3]|uniref:Fibrobacter succinogenes major paralogous domain-containing protein n=1 Tax=Prosthecochloris ethylica TaxID=2743976 RepID=A0ABR9XTI7_9CHLB|nr:MULTISPECIES: fibrobacter succinogenes major paralogous domain-containing protein [Prosthecochloris]MEC9486664.1 fibrobacter succinogenes major paralogous domain-containing protein [Prosthecochloris sp.]MBF0586946.1 fibrobacter succinogenes major paralogous domain-containing protein [Prosthecochloris ethylica]MBF0637177.1 fibrobacter succinogenes major paralogous domain-containing protein [Prosthecochloris ethylica]NUK48185.1 fibrobacter succinogenes major paralogous domain-containing protei